MPLLGGRGQREEDWVTVTEDTDCGLAEAGTTAPAMKGEEGAMQPSFRAVPFEPDCSKIDSRPTLSLFCVFGSTVFNFKANRYLRNRAESP